MNPKNVHIKIELMSKLRDMKKRFLPLSMLLITIVLAQASIVANATGVQGKYNPRTSSKATFSSFMKSIRANQETGLIDPADVIAGQKAAQATMRDANLDWVSAGPDNYGGFTRGVVYNADGSVVIGTMGGGIYKTTNGGITFRQISDMNLAISCMVSDGNGNIFIGTGDGRDAQNFNGLSELGYSASFIGTGVYKLAAGSTTPELLEATTPTANNGWGYVNELTYTNGKLYAATYEGIMMSEDNGASWTNVKAGYFRSVKSNNNGDILAADTSSVYLSKAGAAFAEVTGLEENNNMKIIAMSPTDPNFMYIALLGGTAGAYETGSIYFTNNGGVSWEIAMAATSMYTIFPSNADYEGFMIVYPNNPRKLLIGSDNLWLFEDALELGVNSYRPLQISEYYTDEYTAVAWNRYLYLHRGVQTIAFNPTNPNVFFVGTNGGIFKGEYYESLYSYKSGNRYFITDDEHTSPARMLTVAPGSKNEVIGGSLDHGTIYMRGDENVNNVTTGEVAFPHVTNNGYFSSFFNEAYAGGTCAASTINPSIFFVSGTGKLSMPILRTETGGDDYDGNFEGEGEISNANAFKTPYAFFETYSDNHHSTSVLEILDRYLLPVDTITVADTFFIVDTTVFFTNGTIYAWEDDTLRFYQAYNVYNPTVSEDTIAYETGGPSLYVYHIMHEYPYTEVINFDTLVLAIKRAAKEGDTIYYYSKQGGYPILYTLPEPPHDPAHVDPDGGYRWIDGDSIRNLPDPLKSNYVVGIEDAVYMTRDALYFSRPTEWFLISQISGIPTAVTITADGTTAFVGTNNGHFYTFGNISEAFAAEQADITNVLNPCVTMMSDTLTFAGRAITSISVSPTNNDLVLVTLGNYGNTDYVYLSRDGGMSFAPMTGVPAAPVYSSLIEKSTGLYIIGTENGIYTSENGTTWTQSGTVTCPIMDLKQAIMENREDIVVTLYDEMNNPTYITYPGIHNEGMIYAAAYGAGILSCGTYKEGGDLGVIENEMTENVQLNIYPNPVRSNGNINVTLAESANVSYQIYDLSGRMVANRELGHYGQGSHTVTFSTSELTSGTYIIRLQAGSQSQTAKFLVY